MEHFHYLIFYFTININIYIIRSFNVMTLVIIRDLPFQVLTKSYRMQCHPDSDDPFSFDGTEITGCTGCVHLFLI